MQGDQLLQKWKQAKQICYKVIQMSKNVNIYNKASQKITGKQFMSVHDVVYNLCVTRQKQEKRVSMVYKQFKEILKEGLLSMSQNLPKQRQVCKLQLVRKIWISYTDALKRLMHMFGYLNRPFHIKQGKIQQLQKTGIDIIFTTIFSQLSITQYQAIYFKELDKIRTSRKIQNANTLSSLVTILYTRHLKLTKLNKNQKKQRTPFTDFHIKYSTHTREFYQRTFKLLKELSPSQYFKQINALFEFELAVAQNCFGLLGQALFSRQFSQELMETYKLIFLSSQKGLKSILANKQVHTLKIIINMYRKLLKNVDGFKQQFEQFVYQEIRQYMAQLRTQILVTKNKLNYCSFMDKLIKKNKQFLFILKESFSDLTDFQNYYKSGVQKAFIHTPLQVSIQQILSIYTETKLKSSTLKQDELQQEVKNIITLFNCLQNKDLFLKKYTVKMAKRMITSNDTMINHQTFINNLKENCGMDYTRRLQTLLNQLAISNEDQKLIHQVMDSSGVKIMVGLKIFGQGSWPTQSIIELPDQYLPFEIQKAKQGIDAYRKKYAEKKTFRVSLMESRIRWIYYFEKQAENPLEQCYFDTNTLQGILLDYVYKQRPKPVYLSTIEQYLPEIPKTILEQNLNALSNLPQKILLKNKKQSKQQQDSSQISYTFNKLMKSKKKLINYDIISNEQQQRLFQQQDLTKDRQLIIDANISKFMKSKKIVQYEILEAQILKMIKVFTPARRDIKSSVQRLMNKDIIKRDQKDINVVRYAQ